MGRGAIGSKRLRIEGEGDAAKVVFDYKESATGETKTCRLEPLEFLRRFLQHVPPRRFCLCHRMRGATDTCFA